MTYRIACSPLTGRIFFGRLNKAGDSFIGAKADVTSDVLGAFVEHAVHHGGDIVIKSSDDAEWSVKVSPKRKSVNGAAS